MEAKSVRNMQSIIAVTNKHTAKLHHVGSICILTYDARKLKHKIHILFPSYYFSFFFLISMSCYFQHRSNYLFTILDLCYLQLPSSTLVPSLSLSLFAKCNNSGVRRITLFPRNSFFFSYFTTDLWGFSERLKPLLVIMKLVYHKNSDKSTQH